MKLCLPKVRKPDLQTFRLAIFPQTCVLCDRNACTTRLPVCTDCGERFRRMLKEPCANCGRPPAECVCPQNKGLRFLFWYKEQDVKRLIASVKYHADRAELQALGEMLAVLCTGHYDAVTYVPRSHRSVYRYGYDQTMLLAEAVASRLGLPVITALITRSVVEQKLLSASQREKSMRGRYAAMPSTVAMYPRLLLIDDVSTTGATLRACSALLRKAGAKSVSCAALAKTPLQRTR